MTGSFDIIRLGSANTTVKLRIVNQLPNNQFEVECCFCPGSIFIVNYFGTCPKCKREYGGPHLFSTGY